MHFPGVHDRSMKRNADSENDGLQHLYGTHFEWRKDYEKRGAVLRSGFSTHGTRCIYGLKVSRASSIQNHSKSRMAHKISVTGPGQADQWDWPLNRDDGIVKVVNTDEKFEVALEAVFFSPKEIEVKVIQNQLVIRCLHESRHDQYGEVKREVNRTYNLPPDVDPATIKSNLTARGHLVITAEKLKK